MWYYLSGPPFGSSISLLINFFLLKRLLTFIATPCGHKVFGVSIISKVGFVCLPNVAQEFLVQAQSAQEFLYLHIPVGGNGKQSMFVLASVVLVPTHDFKIPGCF